MEDFAKLIPVLTFDGFAVGDVIFIRLNDKKVLEEVEHLYPCLVLNINRDLPTSGTIKMLLATGEIVYRSLGHMVMRNPLEFNGGPIWYRQRRPGERRLNLEVGRY